MAVAYTGKRFGSAEKAMKVSDKIIIEPQLPRFLTQGDSLIMPVTLVNTTSETAEVGLTVNVNGAAELTTPKTLQYEIEANSTRMKEFSVKASNDVGLANFSFTTYGFDEVTEEIELSVRPASPLVTETGSGSLSDGDVNEIDFGGDFVNSTKNVNLTISRFPAIKFAKYMKDLVGYPYGYLEQTVSRLFPQLYFEEIAKLAAPELYRRNNPVYYVKEGIKKIESMQLYDGSISFWENRDKSNLWSTIYTAHFLLEAKKAGYNVSQSKLNGLLDYISKQAKEKRVVDYTYYENNRKVVKKIAGKENIYALYVLAIAGQPDFSSMNYYKARLHLLTSDTQYLLAGAYGLAGQMTTFTELLPGSFEAEKAARISGGWFDSEIRANALKLNVLLEVDPANEQIPFIIKYLTNNADKIYSTQDKDFAFLGLGKAAKRTADGDIKVEVIADEETIKTIDNSNYVFNEKDFNPDVIELEADGSGETYYFWSVKGVKKTGGVKEEDSFMEVRREFLDYNTKWEINGKQFKQGDLIIGKISLTGINMSAENIVISDLIPTGFEIENPRLLEEERFNRSGKNIMNVEYQDIRDDRLLLFTDLGAGETKYYYYLLRVVNLGEFKLPAISAEAMYSPEIHSAHCGRFIKVVK